MSPGITYNEVAGALLAAWMKHYTETMKLISPRKDVSKEDWKMVSMEYKGGNVDAGAQAVAGTYKSKLVKTGKPPCCAGTCWAEQGPGSI